MFQLFSAAVGWLLFASLLLCVGAGAARWFILPRESHAPVEGLPTTAWLRSRAARLGRLGAALLPAALLLVFLRQVAEFRDPFAPLSEDIGLILRTPWGTAWLSAVVASALGLVGFWVAAAERQVGWFLATLTTVAVAAFPGLTGHASGQDGAYGWLLLGADVAHVLGAGAWIGGLAVVLGLERAWRRTRTDADTGSLLPTLVPRFSPVAMASVATLVASGTLASWAHLPGVSALWTTGYGRLLALKVVLVFAVLGLGALNWKRLTPKLATAEGPQAMRRAAAMELGVASIVLIITALLVRTSPLGH